ncbi:MAG: glycosyltransferase family 2 protein [Christensenellaceae bacterium]
MGIVKKVKNLSGVAKKLKRNKWGRVRTIIRDYGLREFLRRVREKMNYGDSAIHLYERVYVVTNEAYLAKNASPKNFLPESTVSFVVAPRSKNVGRLDILTSNVQQDKNAALTLSIYREGNLLMTCRQTNISHNGYTVFTFLPVLDVMYVPLTFVITSDTASVGVLVNKKRKKHGFFVKGGGSVACKVYTRLDALYLHWMKNNSKTLGELAAQKETAFAYAPKISIVVPLYNTPDSFFREMVGSVLAQTYPNWELLLADGSTEQNELAKIASEYTDSRIKYRKLAENKGISGNSNAAIEMASGEYVALLDHDDTIEPHALYEYVRLLNEDRDYEFIYSDEDKITEDGSRRFDPFFKPDFSPNMLYAFNYITHFTLIKKTLLDEVGYFDDQYNGAQDYDLFLRATEKAKKVGHISDILYHWRVSDASTAYSSGAKEYTIAAGRAAIDASIKRRGLHAHVELGLLPNYYNVVYGLPQPQPKISIIIPNKDEKDTLKKCIDSILGKTAYDNYEIIIIENNSTKESIFAYYRQLEKNARIRVIKWEHAFNFAALNNFAAKEAKGELLLFMNNDMSVINANWLEQMAMHALRPEIGAVGAKLYYPDDTLQHAGIVLRIGGVAGHSHKGSGRDEAGAFNRLQIVHDVSAVTAACLMTRKSVFDKVGGFDEQFVVALNDVDLCLKIRAAGYSIVFTPYAELYHYESKTRGYEESPEKKARFEGERQKWFAKWLDKYPVDPFYNKNLSHELQDYSIDPGKIER